jgi:hypothetical protein
VRAGPPGEDLRRHRARHKLIGDTQGRGGIQGLRDPEPAEQQHHLRGRRKFVSLHRSMGQPVAPVSEAMLRVPGSIRGLAWL